MLNEIIIGLGGLILSVLMFFAGVIRTKKRYDKEDKANRVEAVFDRYMEFRKTNHTGGYDGLLRSGVATLKSDAEIRDLAGKITSHGEKTPIGELDGVDLKKLFTYAANNNVNLLREPINDIVEQSGA